MSTQVIRDKKERLLMKPIKAIWILILVHITLAALFGSANSLTYSATPASSPYLSASAINNVTGLPQLSRPFASVAIPAGASSAWIKHPNSPVLKPEATGGWDSAEVSQPTVLYVNNQYHMWFSGSSGPSSSYRIGYATSTNGIDWVKPVREPVLITGPSNSWDGAYVNAPFVLFHEGMYKMWYRGTSDADNSVGASIGYATSTDGVNWTKYAGNPVLEPGAAGAWDSQELWSVAVVIENGIYKMWYAGGGATNATQIGYATSTDGVNWTKHSANPVITTGPSGSWDDTFAYYTTVILAENGYTMWYSGYDGARFGIGQATSVDGINWTKDPANPIFVTDGSDAWDGGVLIAPSVLAQQGTYTMWYAGRNQAGVGQIGYATADQGQGTLITFLPNIMR